MDDLMRATGLGDSPAVRLAEPLTPEWFEQRKTGITASEMLGALGLSPYETPYSIYLRKKGLLPEHEDNDAMRLGRKMEPIVKSEFVERTGLRLIDEHPPLMRHPEHYFILATPDAIAEDYRPVECKTIGWRLAKTELGEPDSDDVPDSWLVQVMVQMMVTGADAAHIAALVDGRDMHFRLISRNERLVNAIVSKARELHNRIVNDDPPEPDWGHSTTHDVIKRVHRLVEGKMIDLPLDVAEKWYRQQDLSKRIRELQRERQSLRSQVLHALGDAHGGRLPFDDREVYRCAYTRAPYKVDESDVVQLRERKS